MNIINYARTIVTSRSLGIGFILLALVMIVLSDNTWMPYSSGCYYNEANYIGGLAVYGWLPTLVVGLNLFSSRVN
jgi:hypothetical protein